MSALDRLSTAKPEFIGPMYAKPVQALPEGKRWLYEVELDGYRCLAGKESERGNHGSTRFM